jgi:hypothetical protein
MPAYLGGSATEGRFVRYFGVPESIPERRQAGDRELAKQDRLPIRHVPWWYGRALVR